MSGSARGRFAGKIYGTCKDYWVCSGVLDEVDEENRPSNLEKRGTGCNQLVYWVTDNLLHDWIQLPDVTPGHIIAARSIKHIFTGDLNACVNANPPFPGKERHLLRAQLARIFHATALIPKGLFEMDEETSEIKFAEEYQMPPVEDLRNLENWSNLLPSVLKAGRTAHVDPEGVDEEEATAIKEKLEADDPQVERFRTLNEHVPVPKTGPKKEEDKSWIAKLVGDTQLYKLDKEENPKSYCTLVLRSLRWPGAVTVSKGGKFTSVYVGYGMKRGGSSFNPEEPPMVEKDPQEPADQPEPQGEEPKAVVEGEEGEGNEENEEEN